MSYQLILSLQSIYLPQYDSMDKQDSVSSITFLTLAAAAIGFLSFLLHPLIAILYGIVLFLPSQLSQLSHTPQRVAAFTFTTFIFGIINGHTFRSVCQYMAMPEEPPIYSMYLSLMTIYHYFQFQLINNFHHPTLTWHSFLIYHSKQYFLANMFSLSEHLITRYLFGLAWKAQHILMYPALLISIMGESLRIVAFFTCKSNFTHVVRFRKREDHRLVTNGVYSFFRHPSYTGYFYFSVFGQLFIGNFVSCIFFFFVLSKFFNERIEFEEEALLGFFTEYMEYKKSTHILIPFVKDPNFYEKYGRDEEGEAEGYGSNPESKRQ